MSPPEVTGRKFVSKKQVAERYGVVPRTIERWVEGKVLPAAAMMINQREYWTEAVLDEHDRETILKHAAKWLVEQQQPAA